jgi:hypothetical protein
MIEVYLKNIQTHLNMCLTRVYMYVIVYVYCYPQIDGKVNPY